MGKQKSVCTVWYNGLELIEGMGKTGMQKRRKNPVNIVTTDAHMCSLDLRLKILRGLPFFTSLTDEALQAVNLLFRETGYQPDEFLNFAGDDGKKLYVVAEGRVKLLRQTTGGKQIMLDLLVPGEFFGNIGQAPQPYPDTAQAQTSVCALTISIDDFRGVMRSHPAVALAVLDTVTGRLQSAHDTIHLLSVEPAEKRVAHTLLRLARKLGKQEEFGLLIQTPLSREALAEMTGITTETASRVISQFQREGWIDTGRQWVAIKDQTALGTILDNDGGA